MTTPDAYDHTKRYSVYDHKSASKISGRIWEVDRNGTGRTRISIFVDPDVCVAVASVYVFANACSCISLQIVYITCTLSKHLYTDGAMIMDHSENMPSFRPWYR